MSFCILLRITEDDILKVHLSVHSTGCLLALTDLSILSPGRRSLSQFELLIMLLPGGGPCYVLNFIVSIPDMAQLAQSIAS